MKQPKYKKLLKRFFLIVIVVILLGFVIPDPFTMPVKGATKKSYAQNSFWFYPWGESGTHKGVDIFAKRGTAIHSSTRGIVIGKGNIRLGGNYVLVLSPKWRLHYYAHLDKIETGYFSLVSANTKIGTVGSTGNAAGKPPHLHYSIYTLIPYPWRMDKKVQGWKKMFFLDPVQLLNTSFR